MQLLKTTTIAATILLAGFALSTPTHACCSGGNAQEMASTRAMQGGNHGKSDKEIARKLKRNYNTLTEAEAAVWNRVESRGTSKKTKKRLKNTTLYKSAKAKMDTDVTAKGGTLKNGTTATSGGGRNDRNTKSVSRSDRQLGDWAQRGAGY